jgi:hypothetical protein
VLDEEIKTLMRDWFEALNKGKSALMTMIDEDFASDFVNHTGLGREMRGLKDLKQSLTNVYDAFPDIHQTLEEMVVEGDKAALRFTVMGTQKGAFRGIPPSNKKMIFWSMEIMRVKHGKIAEAWSLFDTGLRQQLGILPLMRKEDNST